MKESPNYYAIIPASVRYDNRLTDSEKIMYGEITSLSNKYGICWAGNKYFATLYEVSERTISRRIKNLERLGYIAINYTYKEGTNFIEKRKININDKYDKIDTPKHDKIDTPKHDKIVVDNNTSIFNNTSNNSKGDWFETFWSLYPRKVNKAKAKTSFNNKVTNEETFNLITKDLEKRKDFEQWTKDNGKFIPHPTTYLNGDRWNDEYETKKQKQDNELVFGEYT